MNHNESLKIFLNNVRKTIPFDAMAIRVLDPMGGIPYAVHNGLTDSFIEDEELITIHDCLCGRVTRLDSQNGSPFFTEQGSFWCNSLNDAVISELKRSGIEPRGRCVKEGYKTLLIVPINTGNGGGGNLFFASRKENLLTKADVDLLEDRATSLANTVFKHITECERYNIIVRFIAQRNNRGENAFGKYFEHIKRCHSCHEFYSHNLALDKLIQAAMLQTSLPRGLQSKIIVELAQHKAKG